MNTDSMCRPSDIVSPSIVVELELTDFDADQRLLAMSGVSLVIFTSVGCASCRFAREQLPGLDLAVDRLCWIDAGNNGGVVERYQVFHLPALFVVRDGEFFGALTIASDRHRAQRSGRSGAETNSRGVAMMGAVAKPTIGIIGTGAIGGFYGMMLARAGFDVHFLLRSEFSAVAERGLQLDSAVHGALTLNPVQAYSSAEDMPPCDWLLVGAKTTSNADLAPAIIQAAAPDAKVLLLQNGLDVEDSLRELLPDSLHLLGGLCYICVHRAGPGVITHQALGAVQYRLPQWPGRR